MYHALMVWQCASGAIAIARRSEEYEKARKNENAAATRLGCRADPETNDDAGTTIGMEPGPPQM